MYIPNKFLFYRINDDEFLIINTFTGMIDIIDEKLMSILNNKEQENFSPIPSRIQKRLLDRGYVFENEDEYLLKYKALFDKVEKEQEKQYILELTPLPLTENANSANNLSNAGDLIVNFPDYFKTPAGMEIFRIHTPTRFYLEMFRNIIWDLIGKDKKIDLIVDNIELNNYLDILLEFNGKIDNIIIPGSILMEGKSLPEEIKKVIDVLLQSGFNIKLNITVKDNKALSLNELISIVIENKWHYKPGFNLVFDRGLCNSENREIISEEKYLSFLTAAWDDSYINYIQINDLRLLSLVSGALSSCKFPLTSIPAFNYCHATTNCHFIFAGDGNIYTCMRCIGQRDLAIGNFLNGLDLNMQKIALWRNRKTSKLEECINCEIELLCGGGCPFNSWVESQDIYKPSCLHSKELLNKYITENIKNISE